MPLAFCLVLCRSLFILFSHFFWPLNSLSFFDLRIMITPLVSSNSSCNIPVFEVPHCNKQVDMYHAVGIVFNYECIIIIIKVTRLTRRVILAEQELLTLPEHLSSLRFLMGSCSSIFSFLCGVWLSFCTFSFGHYVVCSSLIYGFCLPLWYLQFFFLFLTCNNYLYR
jgi:hypothetical protein